MSGPPLPPPIHFALKFLLLEVHKQLLSLEQALVTGEQRLLTESLKYHDYVVNYHTQLQNRLLEAYQLPAQRRSPDFYSAKEVERFSTLEATKETEQKTDAHESNIDKTEPELKRSDDVSLSDELTVWQPFQLQVYQQIGFLLFQLSRQLSHFVQTLLSQPKHRPSHKKAFIAIFDLIKMGLNLVEPALLSNDTKMATNLCRLKVRIDKLTEKLDRKLQHCIRHKPTSTRHLLALSATQHLEIISDLLLQIGEQILSANLGQPVAFEQIQSLEKLLDSLDEQFSMHSMAETKSGCTIAGVSTQEGDDAESSTQASVSAIFKQGDRQKMEEERAGVEAWHKKFPGLAPQILSYHKSGAKAALLFEYLTGETFDALIQKRRQTTLKKALKALFTLLPEIWLETQISEPRPAHFMRQLKKRLRAVLHVHPEFKRTRLKIGSVAGSIEKVDLKQLIDRAEKLEKKLAVPNAVYLHGDFNVDNILYDPQENKISFVDLHRSGYGDYVQDLSTFMVSCYRILNFDPKTRRLIGDAMLSTYAFGERFAKQQNDTTFHLRLALGLARGYITSTRFILEEHLAKAMFYRGQLLLEQVTQLSKQERADYRIPPELFKSLL
jgi:aminoglycoside phosphotransferase